ncbi:mitochondrion protein [Histoplasma capsulatum H143]|uniref:Mitochondrion protein n=1 Tax=Ajellomyces capsulatus (strain H143) TaxID=544712 RepID=C6HQW5_AJECH|nr:mitochondrion protein [Histoplasma capsulatum H143]
MAATKRIVVAGGSGFLGSRICKSAVARGWEVVSLSRHGEPAWGTVTLSSHAPRWAKSVEWAKADILKPATYKPFLKDASAVVHSMGILLEADYKGIVQGRESVISGLQKLFATSRPGSQNPLQRQEGEELTAFSSGQLTYELMNRDSAVALAQEAVYENVPTFAFISAAAGAPVVPERYVTSKRDAEALISSNLPDLRSIFIRPTFMYDSSRKLTLPIALGGIVGSEVNALLGGRLSFLGMMTAKPLNVNIVSEAVVEAIGDDNVQGVVGPKKIETLATKGWRRSML